MTRRRTSLVAGVAWLLACGSLAAQEATNDWYVTVHGGEYATATAPFKSYDVVDGSGNHSLGLGIGYDRRIWSRITLGAVSDVSFAAEPHTTSTPAGRMPQLFGTVRARLGYREGPWTTYGTGGVEWSRDRALADRPGWTLGAGIERAVADRWRVDAEYLFGSALDMHQARVGVSYSFATSPQGGTAFGLPALQTEGWAVHGQTTYVSQYAAPFRAPYRGANSLDSDIGRETWDVTLYVGRRLWHDAVVWIDPEIDQGYGLSNTLGVAGFTSGEAYKVGYTHPYVRIPRAFIQQTVDIGEPTETVDGSLNQFAGSRSPDRVVITIGKFSVSDLFDTISYAHDPRGDFMNWSLVDAGTFDYAADAWGFTYGAALEWYRHAWTARAALFDLSNVPNSVDLDTHFHQYQFVYELEHRHTLGTQPGKVAVAGFVSRGRMGRFEDALALAARSGQPADIALVRRYDTRPGVNVNVEQQLSTAVGVFGRIGWADGGLEPYEFADIDRTASAGVSLDGARWGRRGDTLAVAGVINDISAIHEAYLNAGGLGILVGDGQLPHPGTERIAETYYRLPVGHWQITADYQFVINPAYNRDRGPISVFALRLHSQF